MSPTTTATERNYNFKRNMLCHMSSVEHTGREYLTSLLLSGLVIMYT